MLTNPTPLVSVIIPVHNRFDYATEAIASVAEQTYRPIEVIVVDDASLGPFQTPGNLKDLSLRILRSEENIGPGAAREMGRVIANGEFISYLDSDDLWHPSKIATQVKALLANLNAGMCYCPSKEVDTCTGEERIRKWSDKEVTEFLPVALFWRPWATSACLWTWEATEKIGPWFPGFSWEDVEYSVRAGCLGIEISFVPETLCYLRKVDKAVEKRLVSKVDAMHRVAEELCSCNKLENETVKLGLIDNFYVTALKMLSYQEETSFHRCMDSIIDYATWHDAVWWGAYILRLIESLIHNPKITKKIGKGIRRLVLPQYIRAKSIL